METLHKLAGMTETGNETIPSPPPIPQDPDTESQYAASSHRGSRVSLPINRRPSHHSFHSNKRHSRITPTDPPENYPPLPSPQPADRPSHESGRTGASVSGNDDGDFVWGPSHPCFPHPNPHCPPDSDEAGTTRVIRVRRDWLQAGDLYPQYANVYPEILDPLVSDEDFRFLISNLNARLKAIFNPGSTRAWLDTVMGVATGFVWDDLGFTGVKKGVRELEGFLETWNEGKRAEGKEVRVVHLRRTGFMALDFVVPDPGIDVAVGDEEGGIGPAE